MSNLSNQFSSKGFKLNWRLDASSNLLHIPYDTLFAEFTIPESLYSFFNIVDDREIFLCLKLSPRNIPDKPRIRVSGRIGLQDKKLVLFTDEQLRRWVGIYRSEEDFKGEAILLISNPNTKEEYSRGDSKPNLCDVLNVAIHFSDSTKKPYELFQKNKSEVDNLEANKLKKDDLDFISSNKENQNSFSEKNKMSFGHIEGVAEGQVFANRIELGLSGIHTPTQAGIWGKQSEGSASIVLSGGYEDDVDEGDYILYTGQGGRDPDSGKQIKDQEFTRGNKGLQLSKEYNHPVRVTRGYQVEHGPDEGYRYDGLYYVTDYERVKGKEGFYVCRFHLQKEESSIINEDIEHPTSPSERIQYSGNRVKRNDSFAQQIRDLYNNTCQVCKVFLKTPTQGVGISEAAHIKALGKPHNGPDTKANMICLCPNHHAQFDRYSFYIEPETLEIVGLDEFKGQSISINKKHKVKVEFFEYQKQQYLRKN